MTKTLSKILILSGISVFIIGPLAPNFALAKIFSANSNRGNSTSTNANIQNNFCVNLSALSSEIIARLQNKEDKTSERRQNEQERWDNKIDIRNDRKEDNREKWDANREAHFEKLEEMAETNEQMQALLKFREAITLAIANKRTATDQATENFRTGLRDLKLQRQSTVDEATEEYKEAVDAALSRAQADCQNDINPAVVKRNLKNDLKTARQNLNNDRKKVDNYKNTIQTLIETHREAVKEAIDEFKTAIEQAKEEFKEEWAILKNKTATTTEE